VGNSRQSYGGYGVYSYGNCCQTPRVSKRIYLYAQELNYFLYILFRLNILHTFGFYVVV